MVGFGGAGRVAGIGVEVVVLEALIANVRARTDGTVDISAFLASGLIL